MPLANLQIECPSLPDEMAKFLARMPDDTFWEMVDLLDHEDENPYLVVTDTSRDCRFMQTIKKSPRRYLVEYKESPEGPHWTSLPLTADEVKPLLESFACGSKEYREATTWVDITAKLAGGPSNKAFEAGVDALRADVAVDLGVVARGLRMLHSGATNGLIQRGMLDFLDDEMLESFNQHIHEFLKVTDRLHQIADAIMGEADLPGSAVDPDAEWLLPQEYEPAEDDAEDQE